MAVADDQRAGGKQADERRAGEHRLSLAEWLVLCLVREGPTYGLVLVGLLDRNGSVGHIWYVPKATVYLALQRLERQGLIRTTGEQRTSQGPARSLLKATPAGQAAARAWLSTPAAHPRDVRSELMVKLALLDRAGADSRALVRAQLARLLPVAAALDDQLRAATGFEHTLVLWRHAAMTATIAFLNGLTAGDGTAVALTKAQPQGAGTGSNHQDAHHPADHRVREMPLDSGTDVRARQAADAQRDSGRPVGGNRPVVMNGEDQERDDPCYRGQKGGRQSSRGDFPGRPSAGDEDRSQDRATTNAVDPADASHHHGEQDQQGQRNGAGRPRFRSGHGRPGQG
jgi:DNA-binding PadR family transcriptional regulator